MSPLLCARRGNAASRLAPCSSSSSTCALLRCPAAACTPRRRCAAPRRQLYASPLLSRDAQPTSDASPSTAMPGSEEAKAAATAGDARQERAAARAGDSDAASTSSPSSGASTSSSSGSTSKDAPRSASASSKPSTISRLMSSPLIFSPIRAPRHPIVLCHGLYGFDVRGPFLGLEIHYWAAVLDLLRKRIGADVVVRGVPGTGSISERAAALHAFLSSPDAGVLGKQLNFIGHSMGGLDARHLITNIRPSEYHPVSMTSISTPHRGSPFMDWCNANVGVGNEIIEEAVREAKGRKKVPDEVEKELVKVPYTLKSPLFVKPKKEAAAAAAATADASSKAPPLEKPQRDTAAATTQDVSAAEAKEVGERVSQKLEDGFAAAKSSAIGSGLADVAASAASAITGGDDRSSSSSKKSKSAAFGISAFSFTGALSMLGGNFSKYMLSVLDQPAYAMLSTKYMAAVFNPSTPDVEGVKYYSVAARTRRLAVWHPLWLPKLILDAAAESRSAGGEADGSGDALGGELQGNDGLVSVQSAKWGTFLGVVDGCDHWDLRGGGAPRWGSAKLNPATGKPWPQREKGGESGAKEAKEKGEKGKGGWIDINRLLDVFTKKKKKPAGDAAAASAASSSSASQLESSTAAAASSPTSDKQHTAKEERQMLEEASRNPLDAALEATKEAATSFLKAYAAEAAPEGHVSASGPSSGTASASTRASTSSPASPAPTPSSSSTSSASASAHKGEEESGFISEVVEWISDRLPERDDARRAQAERAADALDATTAARAASEAEKAQQQQQQQQSQGGEAKQQEGAMQRMTMGSEATWQEVRAASSEETNVQEEAHAATSSSCSPLASTPETSSSTEEEVPLEADEEATLPRLRRDPAWDRDLSSSSSSSAAAGVRNSDTSSSSSASSSAAAPVASTSSAAASPSSSSSSAVRQAQTLRREMEWRRSERARSYASQYPLTGGAADVLTAASPPSDASTSSMSGGGASMGERISAARRGEREEEWERREADELERFWCALCHHLWREGL